MAELKRNRECSTEKHRQCNCETERVKETRGEKRGGVKTTFPSGSFGKAASNKTAKTLLELASDSMHGSLLLNHMRYTDLHWMERCGSIASMCV